MLQEVVDDEKSVVAAVAHPYYDGVKDLLREGSSSLFRQQVEILPEIKQESDLERIEKQALLEVMMDSQIWSETYVDD